MAPTKVIDRAVTLTIGDAAQAIETCIEADKALMLWGPPGCGKSSIVNATAERLGYRVVDLRMVLLDPVDLRGLPHVENGIAKWAKPTFLDIKDDEKVVIFLDELNRATSLVQNSGLQLVQDRQIGEHKVPDTVRFIAACNRESDGGGVNKLTSAMCNRWAHVNVDADLQDWCKWAVTEKANIHPMVLAFLRYRPELFNKFDRDAKAFPTPRSWEGVSKMTYTGRNGDIGMALTAGLVGDGAAVEFTAYQKLFHQLPNIDLIMMNPKSAPVPKEASALYAVSAALGRVAAKENLERAIQYLERLPVEFNVMSMRDALTRDEKLSTTQAFQRWTIAHSDVVLY